jgi:FixJ family two-component response regulator
MEGASTPSLICRPPCVSKLQPQVVVVDDDVDGWSYLTCALQRLGLSIDISPGIPAGLLSGRPDTPICLILVVKPGRDSFNFQQQLAAANVFMPIIFVADTGDIAMSVRAMKNGAVDFLSKPFRDEDMLEAVETGLARDRAWCEEQRSLSILNSRFETLSQRERQVMERIVEGRLNKQVAFDLGISEVTVKAHRGKVMRKMQALSLPELARMADKIAQSYRLPAQGRVTAPARPFQRTQPQASASLSGIR